MVGVLYYSIHHYNVLLQNYKKVDDLLILGGSSGNKQSCRVVYHCGNSGDELHSITKLLEKLFLHGYV